MESWIEEYQVRTMESRIAGVTGPDDGKLDRGVSGSDNGKPDRKSDRFGQWKAGSQK